MFKGKASIRFGSGAYFRYESISNRIATQPLDRICIFETASTVFVAILFCEHYYESILKLTLSYSDKYFVFQAREVIMKFMVCFDGSEESKEALKAAQHHAKTWGATLEVVNTLTRVEPLKHSAIKKMEDKLEAEVKDILGDGYPAYAVQCSQYASMYAYEAPRELCFQRF